MRRDQRRKAILNGVKVAREVHKSLNLEERLGEKLWFIDVFSFIDELGIPLLFRPLEGLLGAFIPTPIPGIIINSERQRHLQRFTAAHELGHCTLKHSPSFDKEIIGRMPTANADDHPGMIYQEIEAEAFAAEFLLPKWLLIFHLDLRGYTPSTIIDPHVIYQLSLRVNASYTATVWALHTHRILRFDDAKKLASVQPRNIKKAVDHKRLLSNSWADVWLLDQYDNHTLIDANPDDIIYCHCQELITSGYTLSIDEISNAKIISDEYSTQENASSIGSNPERELVISQFGMSGTIKTFQKRLFDQQAKIQSELDVQFHGIGKEYGLPKNAGFIQ